MSISKINKREILFDDLFLKNDRYSGESDYFLDKEHTQPYSGIVVDYYDEQLSWKFSVLNGQKNGLEYKYNEYTGYQEQINENRHNLMFGISKEYDGEGVLTDVSIVYNNDYLKSITIDGSIVTVDIEYEGKYGDRLPEYLQMLLKLDNDALVNYEFKEDNPYLK